MTELFRSNFVFGLQGKLYQNFIDDIAKPIIEKIIETDNYEIIGFERHLSFKDFKNKENRIFDYIYTDFLDDIKKEKENGKVSFKKKVCITLDERLCTDICPNTGRKITTIKLAGVDLAHFIYFEVKEFLDFAYGEKYEKSETTKQFNGNKPKEHINKYNRSKEENTFVEVGSLKDLGNLLQLSNSSNNQENSINNHHIETKIGYIHNHNDGYSYIRTSVNRKETFRVPHRVFPEVKDMAIGTVIKTECSIDEHNQVRKIYSYNQCSEKELNFSFEEFEGKLEREIGNNFAFIKNYGTSIYVPPSWAKYFNEGQVYNVQCLAVESLDKNGNLGWEALEVIEILPFNWKAIKK